MNVAREFRLKAKDSTRPLPRSPLPITAASRRPTTSSAPHPAPRRRVSLTCRPAGTRSPAAYRSVCCRPPFRPAAQGSPEVDRKAPAARPVPEQADPAGASRRTAAP